MIKIATKTYRKSGVLEPFALTHTLVTLAEIQRARFPRRAIKSMAKYVLVIDCGSQQ